MNWNDFMDWIARQDANRKVNYAEIRKHLDPYNVIKAGQAYPDDGVEYFLIVWNGSVRRYGIDEKLYDAEDWLKLIVGEKHVSYFFRKMCEPDGFFMSSLADEVWPGYINKDTRRWIGTASGMAAIAICLCSWRMRPGLDRTRINQHAHYIAGRAVMHNYVQYNPAMREAVQAFLNGERLDSWQSTIEDIL